MSEPPRIKPCSFCGKYITIGSLGRISDSEAPPKYIRSKKDDITDEVIICDNCISSAYEIMGLDRRKGNSKAPDNSSVPVSFYPELKSPQQIFSELQSFGIVNQDSYLRDLAYLGYHHLLRIRMFLDGDEINIPKRNGVFLGKSGCGKSYAADALCKVIGVPACVSDISSVTEAGFIGEEVNLPIRNILQRYPPEIAQFAVCILDEIDKLKNRKNMELASTSVQQQMLSMLSDTDTPISVNMGGSIHHLRTS